MNRKIIILIAVLVIFDWFEAMPQVPIPPQNTGEYSVTDLGVLDGYTQASPAGINNKGEVVGNCYNNAWAPGQQPFIWSPTNSVMRVLGAPSNDSYAVHIDSEGHIFGNSVSFAGGGAVYTPIMWNANTPDEPVLLGQLNRFNQLNGQAAGSTEWCAVFDANANNQAVGIAPHGVSWPDGPSIFGSIPPRPRPVAGSSDVEIPVLWNGTAITPIIPSNLQTWDNYWGWATAIADNGLVVGYANRSNMAGFAVNNFEEIFTSNNGGPPVFLFPYNYNNIGSFYPTHINNLMQMTGSIGTDDRGSSYTAFYNGAFYNMGTLGGSTTLVYGLNNNGQAVGMSLNSDNYPTAFRWNIDPVTGEGVMEDLNNLIPPDAAAAYHLYGAYAQNDAGQIVCVADPVGSVAPDHALLLSRTIIAVDTNRDGEITFDGKDSTTKDKPFRFWLNDDVDTATENVDPAGKTPDYARTAGIQNERDLEDFTRVYVKAPAGFSATDKTWTVSFQFTDVVSGLPGVNLWIAPAKDLKYLTDKATAAQMLKNDWLKVCTVAVDPWSLKYLETFVDPDKLVVWANPDKLGVLLFEGSSAGKGALTVHFYHNNAKVSEGKVYLDLNPITKMYEHWTVGDTADTFTSFASFVPTVAPGDIQPAAGPTPDSGKYTDQSPEDPDYIIFVHGWRMLPWERRAFANTSYKRLWHLGYKGRFALFSWPTRYCAAYANLIEWHNYDASEELAWASAPALQKLLVEKCKLSQGRVRVFAHSMGNQIVSEALLRNAFAPLTPLVQQRYFPLVHAYVATQAATVAQCYNQYLPDRNHDRRTPNYYRNYPVKDDTHQVAGTEYFAGIKPTATRRVNFYNPDDFALADSIWGVNQGTKPDLDYKYFHDQFSYLGTPLNMPANKFTIFAHCDQAWCRALGRQPADTIIPTGAVVGPFSAELNLATIPDLNIGKVHSYEFLNTFRETTPYWEQLESAFELPVPKIPN